MDVEKELFLKASQAREIAQENRPKVEERNRKEMEVTIIRLYQILGEAAANGLFTCVINTAIIPSKHHAACQEHLKTNDYTSGIVEVSEKETGLKISW